MLIRHAYQCITTNYCNTKYSQETWVTIETSLTLVPENFGITALPPSCAQPSMNYKLI